MVHTSPLAFVSVLVSVCISRGNGWRIVYPVWESNPDAELSVAGTWTYPSNIGIVNTSSCNSSTSCLELTIDDNQWIFEQTLIQNMKEFDEISVLRFDYFGSISNADYNLCTAVVSYKFDTQSTFQEPNELYYGITLLVKSIMIPIDHTATTLEIKMETQGFVSTHGSFHEILTICTYNPDKIYVQSVQIVMILCIYICPCAYITYLYTYIYIYKDLSTNSSGCDWSAYMNRFFPDGQCQDDGDECIYIIGMDDDDTYVETWQQGGCFNSYPFYVNDSNNYLCRGPIYDADSWGVFGVNCTEFDRLTWDERGQHWLSECLYKEGDIFECGGYGYKSFVDMYDGAELITKCSDIDLSPVESSYPSSICVQLEANFTFDMDSVYRFYDFGDSVYDLQYGTFSMSEYYSRGGEALYSLRGGRLSMFYVHNDGNRWIISRNTLTLDGWTEVDDYLEELQPRSEVALICNEKDLMDCTRNKWMQNGTVFDRIKVTAGGCSAIGFDLDNENTDNWKVPLIVCGCIAGVILLALGIYYFLKKQNKLANKAEVNLGKATNEMVEVQDQEKE